MNNNNIFYIFAILLIILPFLFESSYLKQQQNLINLKNKWLRKHLLNSNNNHHRSKRSPNSIFSNDDLLVQSQRPCPKNCNCNYDTINCNDLIDTCYECVHWPQIDFNQISQIKKDSFRHFKFAPNRTTHIIIYKLLNSTIVSNTFNGLTLERNSHVEITFQYNSLIRFDKHALNGLVMNPNSTLVFNFPYTTQVLFMSKCFDGISMRDNNAKLILRILKSFSVRFMGDYSSLKQRTSNKNSVLRSTSNDNEEWPIANGQFIIDIKSTHLVKFEENALSNLNLRSNAKLYIDMELVEKLMIQRNSFSNINLNDGSRLTFYAKQITFIDFKAFSFASINLMSGSRVQIYLEELASSLCVQRNVFSNMKLRSADVSFNFSIINSKNVQFMHDSFSDIQIESKKANLYIGVFNMPSLLLIYQNHNFYQKFINERISYLWPKHTSYGGGMQQAINNEYFYNHLNINNGLNTIGLTNRLPGLGSNNHLVNKFDLATFYLKNKQAYSYNVSVEKGCFSNLSIRYDDSDEKYPKNIVLIADNIDTLLVDDFILNKTDKFNNINFLLNVKNLALSGHSLDYVKYSVIEFLREPKLFKFGIAPISGSQERKIKIIGLNTIKSIIQTDKLDEETYRRENEFDYYAESPTSNNPLLLEQDNVDLKNDMRNFNENRRQLIQTYTLVDDNCYLYKMPKQTKIELELRSKFDLLDQPEQQCSCQIIYFYSNHLDRNNHQLPCKLNDMNFLNQCLKQQETKCQEKSISDLIESNDKLFLKDFVKFWNYCITEVDTLPTNNEFDDQDTGNYYYNNFNDMDSLFVASSYDQSVIDQSNKQPPLLSPSSSHTTNSSEIGASSNIGKIIGVVIICFVCGIILFMIIVNIIQYKFRNDLLDDLEYSSQAQNNLNNNCSESSLDNSNEKNGKPSNNNNNSNDENDDDENNDNYGSSNKSNSRANSQLLREKKTSYREDKQVKIKLGYENAEDAEYDRLKRPQSKQNDNLTAINLNEIVVLSKRDDQDSYLDGFEDQEDDLNEQEEDETSTDSYFESKNVKRQEMAKIKRGPSCKYYYDENEIENDDLKKINNIKTLNDSGKSSSASNGNESCGSVSSSPMTREAAKNKNRDRNYSTSGYTERKSKNKYDVKL